MGSGSGMHGQLHVELGAIARHGQRRSPAPASMVSSHVDDAFERAAVAASPRAETGGAGEAMIRHRMRAEKIPRIKCMVWVPSWFRELKVTYHRIRC